MGNKFYPEVDVKSITNAFNMTTNFFLQNLKTKNIQLRFRDQWIKKLIRLVILNVLAWLYKSKQCCLMQYLLKHCKIP